MKKTGQVYIFPYLGEVENRKIYNFPTWVQFVDDEPLVMGNLSEFTKSRREALSSGYECLDLIYKGEMSDYTVGNQDLVILYVDKNDYYRHKSYSIEVDNEEPEDIDAIEKSVQSVDEPNYE